MVHALLTSYNLPPNACSRTQARTTATRAPENNDLIGWMRKKIRAARAARTLFFDNSLT